MWSGAKSLSLDRLWWSLTEALHTGQPQNESKKGGNKFNFDSIYDQRPYMILGSLRDQLTHPRAAGASEEKLYEVLKAVNLSNLPERSGGLDVEMLWADVLSPGEQQRIALARLLLNHPRYAFLDEATSALDVENERLMYHY